jgi:hypothetical protein
MINETYTQAMADAGELPSVGMEYQNGIILVEPDFDGMYVVREQGVSIIAALSAIKPLTPPKADNEKAFDKFLYDDYSSTKADFSKSESDKDFVEGLESAFNAGIKVGANNE